MHCLQDSNFYVEEEFLNKLQKSFMLDYHIDLPSASKIALDVLEILRFNDGVTFQLNDKFVS